MLRTDAFCGTCGEPVPGGKPVVPISREFKLSDARSEPERPLGTLPPQSGAPTSARAVAVVALSDPEVAEPESLTVSRTAIREREPQSEPAPVLPLHRKKNGTESNRQVEPAATESRSDPIPASTPARETGASVPKVPIPPGPPILASDLLREQMRPSSPGEQALRVTTVVLSALGALAVLLIGGIHPLTFVSLALLIMAATLALTPMSYRARAIAIFAAGALATGVALWQQTLHGIAPEGVILATATILLSGSLLFRAYYRGARLARLAVTLGVLALGAWFFVSGGHESLIMLDGHWQSWAPAITHLGFGLLALLSLMAFMDSSTRGGSHVWAVAVLVLYTVHIALLAATGLWPVDRGPASIEGPTIAAILAGTVGTIVAGLALAQILVAAHKASSNRV
ncbi:MAG: hypothetical protein OEN21_14310 [Myxococcales bacterium]|nr:hypothetical protein [Myxococcales bacterium]